MTSGSTDVRVVDIGIAASHARDLVRRRSLRSRLRGALCAGDEVEVLGELYWPIAVVHASARGTGRRTWVERVIGAVDLVSGRIGLLDVDLPENRELTVRDQDLIAPRLSRSEALGAWHEYFRDYVDRRRKPMRPPALAVDRVERLWLPHQLATSRGERFLVDPVTARAEEMKNFPWVEQRHRPACPPVEAAP